MIMSIWTCLILLTESYILLDPEILFKKKLNARIHFRHMQILSYSIHINFTVYIGQSSIYPVEIKMVLVYLSAG